MYYLCTLCFTKIWKIIRHLLSKIFVQMYWSKEFWIIHVNLPFTLNAHFDVISTVICEGETKSQIDGETRATCEVETTSHFDGETKATWDGETKSHFDAETKATYEVETTSHFDGETKAKNEFVLRSRIAFTLTSVRLRLRRFCEIATSERRRFATAKRSRISTAKRRWKISKCEKWELFFSVMRLRIEVANRCRFTFEMHCGNEGDCEK